MVDARWEDAWQDARLKAWQAGIENQFWIRRTARNRYLDIVRSHSESRRAELEDKYYERDPEIDARWDLNRLISYIGSDAVYFLIYVGLFGYSEAATRYRIPLGTVRSRVSRLRKKILPLAP